ncbi:MAG: Rrf2 family transcriptional regulator, partial [Pseudomonadota bacterium]|nr:Rrf2 family transcriptional regulator [Pseudomonadota bacterium]
TIAEIADRHRVSKNHLMKIVNDLARQGVLETTRGRGGGLRLLKEPSALRVGDVLRAAETDFRIVECFDPATDTCTLTPACRLKGVLRGALNAYFAELDAVTLADITGSGRGAGRSGSAAVGTATRTTPMRGPKPRRAKVPSSSP